MRKYILSLGRDSLVFGVGSVAMRLSGILALPIYARVFAPAQLADLELAMAAFQLLMAVLDLGLISAFLRSFFDYGDDPEGMTQRQRIVSTAFIVVLANAVLVAVAFIVFRDLAARIIFVHPSGEIPLVVLTGLLLPPSMLALLTAQLMRACRERRTFVIAAALGSLITLMIGPVLVLAFHMGVEAVLIGNFAGAVAAAVYGVWVTRRWLLPRFSTGFLSEMLKYGLPFLPTAAAFWALSLVDRFMIARMSSLNQLGQYAVANRVTYVLPLLLTGFTLAYGPFIMRLWSEDPELERKVRGRTLTYVTVVIAFVGVALSLFAKEIIDIVAPSYHVAFQAVGLLLVGITASCICSVLGAGMSLTRKTYWNMLMAGIGAAVNIGLNFILIPSVGMVGAAAATAAGYGVIVTLYYANAQRLYHTPYELKKVLTAVAIAVPAGALGIVSYPNLATAVAVKVGVLLAFLVALVATGVIDLPSGVQAARPLRPRSWTGAFRRVRYPPHVSDE
jgi:O-antigen/teichoic acid export membrane protein